jgi:hypothetical protein
MRVLAVAVWTKRFEAAQVAIYIVYMFPFEILSILTDILKTKQTKTKLASYHGEGSIGFVSEKMKKKVEIFHVFGLFIAKKHDLSEKKSVRDAPLPL